MALTKLPKNAIGTGAVDASKIEDGTIQNAELAGSLTGTQLASTLDLSSKTVTLPNTSVTSNQLVNSTIANNKLSNSTITVRGTSRALGDSFSIGVDVDWQSVIIADGSTSTTGVSGLGYFIDTTSAAHTFTLPASATRGDTIGIIDYAGTFATNKLTIARNGHNIQGVANNSLIGTNRASLILVYADVTKGWLFAEENNVAFLAGPSFTSATGGTITTSGNFKIHSFTGDGCFAVSTLGNSPVVPTGGPGNVDYLVVAGGGAGGCSGGSGGGGGGAGGYRTTFPSPGCNAGSFPISATTYPITVGGGGSPTTGGAAGGSGTTSIFSTITSAGGGGGGGYGVPYGSGPGGANGLSGGSGGGGSTVGFPSFVEGKLGGTGNTPPVSPPQGNNGGNGNSSGPPAQSAGGGGGGAGGVGTTSTANNGGAGGAGSANSITGSSVTRAGGGGGGKGDAPGGSAGTGGSGGGGRGQIRCGLDGESGTVNTGGGGGGSSSGGTRSGGSGIVIIRYKFQ
jgi:hypothetical protein